MAIDRIRTLRGAIAGATAAGTWAAQQPLDKRLFGSPYDDVEILGRLVARRRRSWYPAGLAMHLGNGALFGAAYANLAPLLPVSAWARGPIVSLAETFATWPLTRVSDRFHPARDDLPRLTGNRRALWQASWRHLVFGVVLGELERRLNAPEDPPLPSPEAVFSTNGHGSLEHAMSAGSAG